MMFGGGGRHMRSVAQEGAKPTETGKTLRRLLIYFRPFWGLLLVAALLTTVSSLLRLLGPYLTGVSVAQFIDPGDQPRPFWLDWVLAADASRSAGLTATMLLLLATYVLNYATTAAQFYIMTLAGQRVLVRMRTQIFERIQTLSLAFFDRHEAGDLMSRLVNDTNVINQVFSGGIIRLASVSLALIGIPVSMLALNWRLALASFVVLPIMGLTTSAFSRRAKMAFRRTRETIGEVSAELQEDIAAVREVQAFAREESNAAEFETVNAANRDANVQAQSILSGFSPTLDILSTTGLAIVTGFGGYLTLAYDPPLATSGDIVSFLMYVNRFYQPVRMIAVLYAQLQAAIAGAERIFELLDTEPDIVDAPNATTLPPLEGRVEFDRVSFAYEQDEPVLQEVSITAEPGQMVALVGPALPLL
jgi:ATP-binding cassette subfamily B multidrug efflux pump